VKRLELLWYNDRCLITFELFKHSFTSHVTLLFSYNARLKSERNRTSTDDFGDRCTDRYTTLFSSFIHFPAFFIKKSRKEKSENVMSSAPPRPVGARGRELVMLLLYNSLDAIVN
jgi:hypothetical protein